MSSVACRIAAGRTSSRLVELMQEHLFSEVGPCRVDDSVPRPGLFAWSTEDDCYVFIVAEQWTRRGVPLVDVAPLRKHREADSMIARRRSVMTKRVSVLRDVGSYFQAERLSRGQTVSLTFKRRGADSSLSHRRRSWCTTVRWLGYSARCPASG